MVDTGGRASAPPKVAGSQKSPSAADLTGTATGKDPSAGAGSASAAFDDIIRGEAGRQGTGAKTTGTQNTTPTSPEIAMKRGETRFGDRARANMGGTGKPAKKIVVDSATPPNPTGAAEKVDATPVYDTAFVTNATELFRLFETEEANRVLTASSASAHAGDEVARARLRDLLRTLAAAPDHRAVEIAFIAGQSSDSPLTTRFGTAGGFIYVAAAYYEDWRSGADVNGFYRTLTSALQTYLTVHDRRSDTGFRRVSLASETPDTPRPGKPAIE